MTGTAETDGAYPEDWQEQGWCCRDCGAMAWYNMSPELRREFAAEIAARMTRAAIDSREEFLRAAKQIEIRPSGNEEA